MATKLEIAVQQAETATEKAREWMEAANDLRIKLDAKEKELATAKSTSDNWYKQLLQAQAEVDQVHHLLDALPNAPARKGAANEYGSAPTFAMMTRLAAWMAVRA